MNSPWNRTLGWWRADTAWHDAIEVVVAALACYLLFAER